MKNALRNTLLAASLALLTACSGGDERIDATTEQAFEQSMTSMMENMPSDEAHQFNKDLHAITDHIVTEMGGYSMSSLVDVEDIMQTVLNNVHGKTAKEIRALAATIED